MKYIHAILLEMAMDFMHGKKVLIIIVTEEYRSLVD